MSLKVTVECDGDVMIFESDAVGQQAIVQARVWSDGLPLPEAERDSVFRSVQSVIEEVGGQ